MGLPATNREFANEHIHILRFEDDSAVEHWGLHDHLSLMHQLGAPGWTALTPPEVCWYPNLTSLCIEFDRRMGNLDFRFVACCGSGALCR